MATCTVPIRNDTRVDGPRTVNLALGSPSARAQHRTLHTAVLTLTTTTRPGPSSSASPPLRRRRRHRHARRPLTGTNLASGVTVDYAVTGGTATGGGSDYTLAYGTLPSVPGHHPLDPDVHVNDPLIEGAETVRSPSALPPGRRSGTQTATTYTITDNDTPGTVQFGVAAIRRRKRPSGTFNLTVNRTGANLASGTVVTYSVTGGTATGGGDYTLADGALTFAAGQTTASIPVQIVDDQLAEGNETVRQLRQRHRHHAPSPPPP